MHHSRRELIRRGVLGGGGVLGGAGALALGSALAPAGALASGAKPSSAGLGQLFAQASSDADLLRGLLIIEQLLAFAYQHVLSSGGLSGATKPRISDFLSQEHAHIRVLRTALSRAGSSAPPQPSSVAAVSRQLAQLGAPGSLRLSDSEVSSIRYLIGVETVAEGAYYYSSSKLNDPRLAVEAAEIMGCEAQHWTSLSGLLHAGDVNRAVPYPVVVG